MGASFAAMTAAGAAYAESHQIDYGLLAGKPFEGTTLNILSVVTPQFDGLMLRDDELTELTGIELEWTFIPFGGLQEKLNAEGVAANGIFDVVNYLDTWGPPKPLLAAPDPRPAGAGRHLDGPLPGRLRPLGQL
ncbi:hypothetical protein [Jannaschia seohaensis]|uniref:hypothetical protein n=1 Tax=Jannaschia seohaensis TaxID=475081 RepID=UPI001FE2D086|nr:hypothetical protein [Jannaschia seohaensis]